MSRIGFTTMSFKSSLQKGEVTLEALLEWGGKNGFSWVEVRDFDLSFSRDALEHIRRIAEKNGLRPHYAWDGSNVGDDCPERFLKGIENAACFGVGTHSRVVIAPQYINPTKNKFAYSPEEILLLLSRIGTFLNAADKQKIVLVFENSIEALDGEGGLAELLINLPAMKLTLDTANPFPIHRPGEGISWPELRDFVQKWKQRIPYVHLKSSRNRIVIPELATDAEAPLPELLPLLNKDTLLCVELPDDGNLNSGLKRVTEGFRLIRPLLSN